MPRRHDLVWLDPVAGCWDAVPEDRAALHDWIHRKLPLTAARRSPTTPAGWLNLGFTQPGRGPRRRVTVSAAPTAILHHRPPLTLAEALPHAPRAWRTGMATLLAACRNTGLEPRIYGSLATQIFSGEPCLRTGSDLDLLIDCADARQARAALKVLTAHTGPGPRLDGELRLPCGRAVAWRELAAALAAPASCRVLAKSDTSVALVDARQFLAAGPSGASRGTDRQSATCAQHAA